MQIHFIERDGEVFTHIKGFKGRYLISDRGNVYGIKRGRLLKPVTTRAGYKQISIYLGGGRKNSKLASLLVHGLVAKHFVNGWDKGLMVDHIDRNRSNNIKDNLRWVSATGNACNMITQSKHGLYIYDSCTERQLTPTFKVECPSVFGVIHLGCYSTVDEAIIARDEFMSK